MALKNSKWPPKNDRGGQWWPSEILTWVQHCNQRFLKFCVQIPGLLKNVRENSIFFFFFLNESTENLIVESLAWIIFPEFCLDKSWKLTDIFHLYQIETGTEIFNNKNCKVTFGFEYIFYKVDLWVTLIHYPKYNISPSNSLQDMKQNRWTIKYRSLTYIHLISSIYVSYWSIIPTMICIHQIILKILSKITRPWNIGHADFIYFEVKVWVTLSHYLKTRHSCIK